MSQPTDYIAITVEQLGDKRLLPFDLYLECHESKTVALFLTANTPLTKTKRQNLVTALTHQKNLVIDASLKRFLEQIEPSMAPASSPVPATEISTKVISDVIYHNQFITLIELVRKHIADTKAINSAAAAMISSLCQEVLTSDNQTNRSVAIAYTLVHLDKEFDENAWSDIVCAAFFANLGQTMVPKKASEHPKKYWQNRVNQSVQMIRKAQLPLSERCKKTIEQHQEFFDGSGYPQMRQGAAIEPLALTLNLAYCLSENSIKLNAQDFFVYLSGVRRELAQKYGPRAATSAGQIFETLLNEKSA